MSYNIGRERGDVVRYSFVCDGCGSTGVLDVPISMREPLACPEGCGATYVQWKTPAQKWMLTCVVCPIAGEPEDLDTYFGDDIV